MTALRNNRLRRHPGLALTLLLSIWLGLSQIAVAAHDAIHHVHAHVDLCDILSAHGNGPAMAASVVTLKTVPVTFIPGCSLPATLATANPYPAFHSRAPPR